MSTRGRRILDWFIQSEYFQDYQDEQIQSGAYSQNEDRQDRFARCYDAAETGSDGSTHAEHLEDMRDAFRAYLRDKRCYSYCYRVEEAVMTEIDNVELWHETNGTLDTEVG